MTKAEEQYAFRIATVRQLEAWVRSGLEPYSYVPRPMSRQALMAARNGLWQQIAWANAAYRQLRNERAQ